MQNTNDTDESPQPKGEMTRKKENESEIIADDKH